MKKLLTASMLLALCLSAKASAQVTTTTLILEDDATTLGSLNQITISAPPDADLTSNYFVCFPNQDGLDRGSFMYISGSGLNSHGQFAYHFDWLAAGGEGDVLMMAGGVPRWRSIAPASLPLSQNALWIGDAADHASELAAGTSGQVLQINGLGVPGWTDLNLLPAGSAANTTLVWDGTKWIENANVTMDPATGNVFVNGDLTVNGTNVNLPAGSIDNSELANSSVNVSYGTGLSGDASVALGGTLNLQNTGVTSAVAGTGINLSGGTGAVTITNTGVTSLTGTTNQVNVSASNGAVTISLPQDIDQNATPTFDGVVLDNLTGGSSASEVVVSNGGTLETRTVNSLVGASNLTQNSVWVGNASNNPSELAPGTSGQVLKINAGGSPAWANVNDLPAGTTNNATLVWNGTNWVENTNVTMNPANGDITTNGDVNAAEVTTTGAANVGGNLTVTGPNVNLPAGSIDNSELANDDVNVTYGTGLSGDASVVLGGTLNLQNTGVTSLTGTSNQVNVSASSGAITVSLPQNIDQNATPTFDGVVLDNLTGGSNAGDVVVSNGGSLETRTVNSLVGASNLTQNSVWVGNATNNPSELAAGSNGQILTVVGGAPTWQTPASGLPNGTATNSTLVWNGTSWVENTNVTLNPVTGDVNASGSLSTGGNASVGGNISVGGSQTIGGNTTISGNLVVNGSDVTLPAGSIDNSELANDDINVTYGTGLSGDASVVLGGTLNLQNTGVTSAVAGTGINLSGGTGAVTITNTGVTSLAGTTNQVNVSASNGAVTVSLPQDIHTGATPTFNRMTLTNMQANSGATQIVVSNNGVLETRAISSLPSGSTTLNHNSMWVGNASNQATQLGSTGVSGAVLQLNNGGSPSWSNDLNVHNVSISSALTVNGNQVNNGDVRFNGNNFNVSGSTNSVFDGPLTVNGATTLANSFIVNGSTTLNSGLTVNGSPVNLPNNSINNSELEHSSINVNYGTGLSGDGSVALGGTLNLQNTGVTSLTGTSNQVNVSASNGAVTVSLPQNIHTGATPTFNRMTLTNMQANSNATQVVVSNNGVLETRPVSSLSSGSSTSLNHNSMWVGNASNQATQLGSTGVSGAVLQLNNAGSPSWSNDLNVHNVSISSALNVNGNQVNNGDVRFNGNNFNVSGSTNSVFDGPLTVNGATTLANSFIVNGSATLNSGLTVNGSPVNLPNNSINNSELEHSSINVNYGTGLSGDGSVALGGTLNLQNTGVTSLTGTSNQVNVSASNGAVTVSLPQNIHTGATPTFNRMTLANMQANSNATQVVVSNNGVLETRDLSSIGGGSGSGWSLTGNSGTTAGTNFLGTTDNVALDIRVNNQRVFRFVPNNASPNLIGGYSGNSVSSTGTEGNAVLSGGANNEQNVITDYADYSLIGGGAGNSVGYSADYTVIAGGYFNEIDQEADYSFIGAGQGNTVYDRHSAIVSGFNNSVGTNDNNWTDGAYSGIVSGYQNSVSGYKSFIGAGLRNAVTGDRSAVVAGEENRASGTESFVGGGEENVASGSNSFIGGGKDNTASDSYSAIPGGRGLTLSGSGSFGFLAGNTGSNNMTISADDIAVFGNADLWLANNSNDASQLRFYEAKPSSGTFPAGANYTSFEARSQSADIRYLLPSAKGSAGDVLAIESVNGSDVALEWANSSGSGGSGASVQFARKTADEVVSGTTLQDDDDLSISLSANSTYEVSGVLYVEREDGNPDMDIAWSVPGGTGYGSGTSTMTISFIATERQNSGNRDMGADIRTSSGTSPGDNAGEIDLASNGGLVIVHFKGLVMTGSTSGDITLKWAPTSGGGDEVRVRKNSYMTALKLQ